LTLYDLWFAKNVMKNLNQKLLRFSAKNRLEKMRTKYNNKQSWQLFATQIQFNQDFRAQKLDEQNYICPVCEEQIFEHATLHHIDYDHSCQLFKLKGIQDCKLCKTSCPNFHIGCRRRTVMVHHKCHKKLH